MTAREETEQYIRETEARIVEQIARIRAFDASGRSREAMVARNLLGAVTEKRDALRMRLGAIEAVERSKGLDPASVPKPAIERPLIPDAPAVAVVVGRGVRLAGDKCRQCVQGEKSKNCHAR